MVHFIGSKLSLAYRWGELLSHVSTLFLPQIADNVYTSTSGETFTLLTIILLVTDSKMGNDGGR